MLENAPFLPSGQRACKHILAVLITEALQAQDEPVVDIDGPIAIVPKPAQTKAERDALRRYAVAHELT